MTSAFIAIFKIKQTNMTEKQLTNFSFYLSQEAVREYLCDADIYKGKKRLAKNELIEMIITSKPKAVKHCTEDDELTKEDAIMQIDSS